MVAPGSATAPGKKAAPPFRWRGAGSLLLRYWRSRDRWPALGFLSLLIFFLLVRTLLQVVFIIFSGELTTALVEQDQTRFFQAVQVFLLILVVGVPLASLSPFLQGRLSLRWRNWLTQDLLGHYFRRAHYYQLSLSEQIDNPDQRLQEDVRTFTQETLRIVVILLQSIFQLLGFAGVLWSISKGLMGFLVVYALFGTVFVLAVIGRPLVRINARQLQKEADFRYGLARIRDNGEAIALYRGEPAEGRILQQRLGQVLENFKRLIRWQFGLNIFQNHYRYVRFVAPTLILAPAYLAGNLEIGQVTQAGTAFNFALSVFALVVLQFQQLTNLGAVVERLDGLTAAIEALEASVDLPMAHLIQRQEVGDRLILDQVTVTVPTQSVSTQPLPTQAGLTQANNRPIDLFEAISCEVAMGNNLLIVGPSGSGKSSLLRAIAGLWQQGSGRICLPAIGQLLFLPQTPYLIAGTLRKQLLYPGDLNPSLTDSALTTALQQVNLGNLITQTDGLEQYTPSYLSGGEQQRLAFARVLLQQPNFAFLDEATSALDLQNEALLYGSLQQQPTAYVSVGHRLSLVEYHQQVLELLPQGQWRLWSSAEYAKAMESRPI